MPSVGRAVKEAMVTELSHGLVGRPNFFLTTVNRLPAPEADVVRRKLHAVEARLIVLRWRLGRRALEPLNIQGLAELIQGATGLVVVGDDALRVAKLLVDCAKTYGEQLGVHAAVIDGQLLDKHRVQELASLPPKPVLLAQVLATIESPLADVVFTLERTIGDLMYAVEQLATQREQTPPASSAAGVQAPSAPASGAVSEQVPPPPAGPA